MRITMIGAGYVGLVTGACFADFGHDVICVDTDQSRIDSLLSGKIPIYEPGLETLVAANVAAKRLSFSLDLAPSVKDADAVFIAVGTPSRRGDGHADLQYVYQAAKQIAESITGFTVIVTKSTVPVGTSDEVSRIIKSTNPDADFAVASNPEFLREGAAIRDFKLPDRIVIGTEDARARQVMSAVYRPLHVNQGPLFFTTRRTAELIKYAANAFLATKVTFINEIADLCEAVGADAQEVARGIGLDGRIGSKFLHPGPGYGGSCFPKDTLALVKTAHDYAVPMRIVETVALVNDQRKRGDGGGVWSRRSEGRRAIGASRCSGLAFKSNTDDMRDAPSISIVSALKDAGADVVAFDPAAIDQAKKVIDGIAYATDAYSCAAGADAIVVVTEWDAFRALDLGRLKATMKGDVLVEPAQHLRTVGSRGEGFSLFRRRAGRSAAGPETSRSTQRETGRHGAPGQRSPVARACPCGGFGGSQPVRMRATQPVIARRKRAVNQRVNAGRRRDRSDRIPIATPPSRPFQLHAFCGIGIAS